MAQAIDSSSAPLNFPSTSTEIHAVTKATTVSPSAAPVDDQTVDRCVQDMDPSHAAAVTHNGDCTLDCCHCATRWSARRILLEEEA